MRWKETELEIGHIGPTCHKLISITTLRETKRRSLVFSSPKFIKKEKKTHLGGVNPRKSGQLCLGPKLFFVKSRGGVIFLGRTSQKVINIGEDIDS